MRSHAALRVRLVALTLLIAAVAAMLFWPVVMTYTFVYGEKATASVTNCETIRNNKSTNTTCTGTWRAEGGDTGSGEIYGLDKDQEGDTVPVRLGPMGPYAGGFGRSWYLFLTAVPLLLAPLIGLWALRATLASGRKLAESLLADPAGGTLLVVSGDKVFHADGLPHATLSPPGAPSPGHRPVEVPGRRRRLFERTGFDRAAGLNRDATEFRALTGPRGHTLAVVEYRSGVDLEPEDVLLDPSGTPLALIRRIAPVPRAYEILDPGGTLIGSAANLDGRHSSSLRVTDSRGATVATIAHTGRRCVVRVESTAPPPFRDVAIVIAFATFRTTD
ncbi:hypothetical protein [Actinomadura sp. 6K520]|uniref:hypothetical protein n=1 Tax=Actinomadura sp. 6K520 TaxID=2530364 RepID=UPI0010538E5E|nr:hypothetical protein [Actinomadura sp. 6K520]TDE33011.1 hypothetical protein E1289_13690 [Actinomadura sp. 6K520]